jgi:hypothetical protein
MLLGNKKTLTVVILFITATFAALAIVSARNFRSTKTPVETSLKASERSETALPAPSELQDNQAGERIEAEIITIRPNGFEPAEITRPQGRFLLAINNRSGISEMTLRLNRDGGNEQRDLQAAQKTSRKWRDVVDLYPGRYLLKEAAHPDWVCRITITAR